MSFWCLNWEGGNYFILIWFQNSFILLANYFIWEFEQILLFYWEIILNSRKLFYFHFMWHPSEKKLFYFSRKWFYFEIISFWFDFILSGLLFKGTFLSESTDVSVITSNRRTFFFPETENLNFGDWKLLRNQGVLKFESLEPCNGKKAIFGWLRQP